MEMIICDLNFDQHKKTIQNVFVIPRIGERIGWFYAPAPKVQDVFYDYDAKVVYVYVK